MATSVKKVCIKCGKSGGVFTCDGCEKSFCGQHTAAHRQELAHQLDVIGQEHDLLRRDLKNYTGQDSILARINAWENESTIKIKMVAEKARTDLRQLREQLGTSCNQISDELRSSRELDNYSEIDLSRWMEKLQLLRNELEMPTRIGIEQKQGKDSIDLIKIYQINVTNTTIPTHERFNRVVGYATLSKDHLNATISETQDSIGAASICGASLYSSGLHKIYFEITNKTRDYLFFGIMSSVQRLTADAFSLLSTYGWWDAEYSVLKGISSKLHSGNIIKTGDKITLTLDCDHGHISYIVERTKKSEKLKIDMNSCPFPWNFLIVMDSIGDSVHLLSNASF
jgi:hypothetical protein